MVVYVASPALSFATYNYNYKTLIGGNRVSIQYQVNTFITRLSHVIIQVLHIIYNCIPSFNELLFQCIVLAIPTISGCVYSDMEILAH